MPHCRIILIEVMEDSKMNEKIGIVVSDFNADVTHLMAKIAEEHAQFLGAKIIKTLRVPGAFDVPLGVTGPKISHAGAVDRIEEYAKRSVESCLKMLRRLS